MCNLDISERRLPQDGRIVFKQFTKKSLDIDLRVSTAPLNHGEGVVMRILDKQKSTLPLPALGFTEENLAKYRDVIRQPYGMILHCGPTGSGKSMTLYSALTNQHARHRHPHRGGPDRVHAFRHQTKCRCTGRSGSRLRRPCGRSCGRTPTSSSWAKFATGNRGHPPSRRRSPVTC